MSAAESLHERNARTLPLVLVHCIMHMCDPISLLRLARCSRQFYADASDRMAWKELSDGCHMYVCMVGRDTRSRWTRALNWFRHRMWSCCRFALSGRGIAWWKWKCMDEVPIAHLSERINQSLLRFCDMMSYPTEIADLPGDDDVRLRKLDTLENLTAISDRLEFVTRVRRSGDQSQLRDVVVDEISPVDLGWLSRAQPHIQRLQIMMLTDLMSAPQVRLHAPWFPNLHTLDITFVSNDPIVVFPNELFFRTDLHFPALTTLRIPKELLHLLGTLPSDEHRGYETLDASLRSLHVRLYDHPTSVYAFVRAHLPHLTHLTLEWISIPSIYDEIGVSPALESELTSFLAAHVSLQEITLSVPSFVDSPDTYVIDAERALESLRSQCIAAARAHASHVRYVTRDVHITSVYCLVG